MHMMSNASRIRVTWAFQVITLCQRSVLQAHTADPVAFVDAFELLADRLPSAQCAAERIFLVDRLRELTLRANRHLDRQMGFAQWFADVRQFRDPWPAGPTLQDPRTLLREWLRGMVMGFRTMPTFPPATRAALHLHTSARLDGSLNLNALAASVGCSRSVLTRNFRKLLGQSICEYRRKVRLRRAIVMLSTTDWPVASIARLVGYRSTNNLYVALRSITSQTPAALRCASPSVLRDLIEGRNMTEGFAASRLPARRDRERPGYDS